MRACGCPDGGVVPPEKEAAHREFHDLVEQQTGIAYGQELSFVTLKRARGIGGISPDDHKTREKNLKSGKSSPGWRRKAHHEAEAAESTTPWRDRARREEES